jgi:hypothetical protein
MYTIFSDSTGRREGLVLAQGDNRLRLAVRGSKDAVELERSQGRWAIDGGEPVQIEFLTIEAGWSASNPLAMHATAGVHKQVA